MIIPTCGMIVPFVCIKTWLLNELNACSMFIDCKVICLELLLTGRNII
jgi:hypothetical protein